mmetsp:Transcript_114188/g.243537  ORF Transcript_114188/g.243537 Transcript_114188/m.243537 type:complete len:271 (+) Transcript_114188:695-1507(+)
MDVIEQRDQAVFELGTLLAHLAQGAGARGLRLVVGGSSHRLRHRSCGRLSPNGRKGVCSSASRFAQRGRKLLLHARDGEHQRARILRSVREERLQARGLRNCLLANAAQGCRSSNAHPDIIASEELTDVGHHVSSFVARRFDHVHGIGSDINVTVAQQSHCLREVIGPLRDEGAASSCPQAQILGVHGLSDLISHGVHEAKACARGDGQVSVGAFQEASDLRGARCGLHAAQGHARSRNDVVVAVAEAALDSRGVGGGRLAEHAQCLHCR